MNETLCLQTNPFEGDFGSPSDKILKDKIVTSKGVGSCFLCGKALAAGERSRSMTAIFDGALSSYKWCNECCVAMEKSWTDDGVEWEARAAIGRKK